MVGQVDGTTTGIHFCHRRNTEGSRPRFAVPVFFRRQDFTARSHAGTSRSKRWQTDSYFLRFDPRRTAILLIGGDKTGNDRFYEEFVPVADRLYDVYLDELRTEGLIR